MKFQFALLLGMILTGCSFKEAVDGDSARQQIFSRAQVLINWNGTVPTTSSKVVDVATTQQSGLRDLIVDSSGPNLMGTVEAITLPPIIPKCVYAEVRLRNQVDFTNTLFVRAKSTKDDGTVQTLLAEIIQPALPGRFTIQLCGLSVQFSETQTSQSRVNIELFSTSQKLATFNLLLRTPPSKLQLETLTLSEWLATSDVVQPESWLRAATYRGQIELVQVLKVVNQDDKPIEIQIPRNLIGEITQWTNEIETRDLGCSATTSERPQVLQLAKTLHSFPLDLDFTSRAWGIEIPTDEKDRYHLYIPPKETAWIGIYGDGEGLEDWSLYGPKIPELRDVTVPGNCYTDCVKYFPCGRYDPGCESERPCAKYESGRRPATFNVGVNRGPVLMDIDESVRNWDVRFSDLDLNQDRITRPLPFLQSGKELGWIR